MVNLNKQYYLFQHKDVLSTLSRKPEFLFPDNFGDYSEENEQYVVDPFFYDKTTSQTDAVKFKTNYDYYKFFPLIRKFYETFEDDIILSRHDSNISILDKVGIDNFINLANLLYKYVNMYGSGYMSVDELIRESDSIVQKMVDYSKKDSRKK